MTTTNLQRGAVISVILALAACQTGGDQGPAAPPASRDLDELQAIKSKPRPCADIAECPTGSYCDVETAACAWECLADSDCDELQICSEVGACIAGISYRSNDDASCGDISPAARRSALITLRQNPDPPACSDHSGCICGSYCDNEAGAICRVECLPPGLDNPAAPPELEMLCGSGQVCSPLGQCVAAPPPPPPPYMFTMAMSPAAVDANTGNGPVVREVAVQLITDNILALSPTHAARVTITTDGAPEPGEPRPRVKCSATGAFADSCVFAGGWQWNIGTGDLRSAPRTVWIEVPAVVADQGWSVEARSQWAGTPAVVAVAAEATPIPGDDPGHYRGRLIFSNGGAGAAANQDLTVAVEAIVTPTHVVLLEATRIMFPDGHVVLSREAVKATMLPWLTAAVTPAARYDVRFDLGILEYDPVTGRLAGELTLTTGAGDAPDVMSVALERTGEEPFQTCGESFVPPPFEGACPAGSHCRSELGVCLPGTAAVGSIVEDASAAAQSSRTLPSVAYQTWAPTLPGLISASGGKLGGGGVTGLERAYCHQSTSATVQPGPARFLVDGARATPSEDLQCNHSASATYPQATFDLVNKDQELIPGQAFDLFATCLADLAASTTASPLGKKECVSLARFFLALDANNAGGLGQPMGLFGQRLVNQVLRQWLNVNAYVASTAVRVREYDDVLAASPAPAHERLGTALDQIESGLRVMLDPRVRGQYRSGADLRRATFAPDYRVLSRPFARWPFNASSPGQETERGQHYMALDATTGMGTLQCNRPNGIAYTQTHYQDGLADGDGRFTIVTSLRFSGYPRGGSDWFTLMVAEGEPPDGSAYRELMLHGRPINPGTASAALRLLLEDANAGGGYVEFPPIAGDRDGNWGFLAIVVDAGTYRLFQQRPGLPLVVLTGQAVGRVRWAGDETFMLSCAPTTSNKCPAWSRYVPGDNLAPYTLEDWTELPRFNVLHWQTGVGQAECDVRAHQRRTALLPTIWPGAPAQYLSAFTVTSGYPAQQTTRWDPVLQMWSIDFWCPLTINDRPKVVNQPTPTLHMPACGAPGSLPYTDDGITYDELSLWNRALSVEEFGRMASRYANNPANQSLPPPDTSSIPGQEQATALPAHMLEAAGAGLGLLAEYIEAERNVLYNECVLGGTSPARARVLDRAGRNLRLAALLEGEAVHLGELPQVSTAPWYPRYQAARRQLAGKRTEVLRVLQLAFDCQNPLGITEEDVPLFIGQSVGADAKFFASTRFLVDEARREVTPAGTLLSSARAAYLSQRQSQFQVNLGTAEKTQRLNGIRTEYEGVLRKLCGPLPNGQTHLPGFLSGQVDANSCFFKTPQEQPGCTVHIGRPISEVPPSCVRGELGEHLLAAQAAGIESDNALNAYDRAQGMYDTQTDFCIRRAAFGTAALRQRHRAVMKELREERQILGRVSGVIPGILKEWIFYPILESYRIILEQLDNEIADEQAEFQDWLALRAEHQEDMACYHQADLQKFSIDAQRDVIRRASQSAAAAVAGFESARASLRGLVDDAAGQLGLEAQLVRAPAQFHYWLHQDIEQYHRHMHHARRLTYLALRAFEYEGVRTPVQMVAARNAVLSATLPTHLTAVLDELAAHTAPIAQGYSPRSRVVVLSLRDEILRLHQLIDPGSPPASATRKLRDYLRSDHGLIYNDNHELIGRGVRFSVVPDGIGQHSCAERIWRVTVSLQATGGAPSQHDMLLRKMNAFASQTCDNHLNSPLGITRVRPSANLLRGEVSIVPFIAPRPYTSTGIDGPVGLTRDQLENLPENPNWSSTFAGRGIYGDYALIFGSNFSDAFLKDSLDDVLIRFDTVELTDD